MTVLLAYVARKPVNGTVMTGKRENIQVDETVCTICSATGIAAGSTFLSRFISSNSFRRRISFESPREIPLEILTAG